MKMWLLALAFTGILNTQDDKWEVVNGRRVLLNDQFVRAYRYNPYGMIIDRSSGRPIPVFSFVIDRFCLHVKRKDIS